MTNTNIKVMMSGREYITWKQKNKLSKKTIELIIIFSLCFIGLMFAIHLIQNIIHTPQYTSKTLLSRWMGWALLSSQNSWSAIAKYILLLLTPIVAISWLIHGVKVRLLA